MKKTKLPSVHKYPLGAWTAEDFIHACWQQEPLFIPQAILDIQSLVSKQDLVAMACQSEVEARLITVNEKQNHWQCSHGPFRKKQFQSLGNKNWTLLVQAIDQWMPEVAALLSRFNFLPRWRLDDIMVSYAAQGGGVGPHFDQYDVFLIQVSGTRYWELGQRCNDKTVLRSHPDLKLLKQFKKMKGHEVKPGDLLYIPPGVAHWGTAASDDCITLSVGFRAPSQGELLQMALGMIAQQLPQSVRYRDHSAAIDRDPYCINDYASDTLYQLFKKLDTDQIKQSLVQALGEYATEPRYPDHVAARSNVTAKQLVQVLKSKKVLALHHHHASRFAYHPFNNRQAALYVDGEAHLTSLKLARALCHGQVAASLLKKEEERLLLLCLLNQGSLSFA